MNSWLGGGLSSLKGQLSHLITEGTEEILDPNVEIDNAKRKIVELESQLESDANEIEQLKEKNGHLLMKLQSEELLMQNVSQSYQDKLREKEEIIEALTNKLSTMSRASDNDRDDMTATNNRISASDDSFSNDFFDHFQGSHKQATDEIGRLQDTIRELHHEIAKWRLLSEERNHQDDPGSADQSGATFEATINKLLEDQQRELEMRHSNYVLEVQHEHSNQISFLNAKIHSLQLQGSHYDDNLRDAQYSDTTDAADESRRERALEDASTQTDGESALCDEATDRLAADTSGADILLATKLAGQLKMMAFADSVSQVSDISEVSIKSRLLDEHVRHLTNQVSEYERQLSQHIEHANGSSDNGAATGGDTIHEIGCKIEELKAKLSQRKHGSDQPHLPEECAEEEAHCNAVESWENSSVNSLVEETVDPQPGLPCEAPGEAAKLDRAVRDLYGLLFPESGTPNDASAADMAQLMVPAVTGLVVAANEHSRVHKQLMGLYNELNCANDESDAPADLLAVLDWLADSLRSMRETCSVHDYIIEENKSLRDLVDQLRLSLANADGEKRELVARNSELDEQLMDMSITIARYDGLEKICDKYQRHMDGLGQQDILEHVETFNQEKDECIQSLESQIVSLHNLCEEKDDRIAELEQRQSDINYEYDSLMNVLNGELDSLRASVENLQETELSYKRQIQELHEAVRDKDAMIQSLNEELTMLSVIDIDHNGATGLDEVSVGSTAGQRVDGCSQTAAGDHEHGEALQALVAETHRLEQVIEAQATSLAQYDTKVAALEADLSRLKRLSTVDPQALAADDDMTKETLHHLSQMIRDNECEMEALRAKNDSLCAIIKKANAADPSEADEAGGIDYVESLLAEKARLLKELGWYQHNRDQLISSLNLKHKESLNYHGELQRLIAYINTEQAKWTEFVAENERLKEQLGQMTEEAAAVAGDVDDLVDSETRADEATDEAAPVTDETRQLRERCLQLEHDNRQSGADIRALQKQIEHISFELEQSYLQTAEATSDLTRTQHQLQYCQNELANQYKRVPSPSQSVDSTKDIWRSAEYRRNGDESSSDVAVAPTAAAAVATEGNSDHWQQQLVHKQVECDNYANEIEQLKAREVKLLKEKQIFQDHLIRVEESYTQDATLAEDREQALRQQLRHTEDSLHAASTEIGQLQAVIASIRTELQHELVATRLERDDALNRLREAEAQLVEHMRSVTNLQSVLDHFQQDQASEALYQREKLQHDLQLVTADRDRWERQCRQLEADIDGQHELVEAARRLSQQMEHKDDQLAEIQAALARKEEMIDALRMEIRKLNTVTESKVDKVLMKNMVIGYFHTPQHRRQEALKVIGSLLQFADADYNQIGIDTANKSRWFSWLRPPAGGAGPAGDKTSGGGAETDTYGKSFSELFISFLERESSPLPQMKLPTNQIAAEARHHSSLSQSYEYPYTPPIVPVPAAISDHHKFFASSPVITKRNGSPSDQSEKGEPKDTPLLYIPSIKDINSEINQKDHKVISNHRRSESGRNALLSLLDQ